MDALVRAGHVGRMTSMDSLTSMTISTRALLIGATLLASACGSGPISGDDELGDAGESDSGTSETGTSDTDTAETGTSDTGDTGETGEDGLCISAEGTLGPAALRLDPTSDRAWVIEGAGELELALDHAGATNVWLVADAEGSRIAIARNHGVFDQDLASTLHGFDRASGELAWTRELDGVATSQLWVGDEGWIAGSVSSPNPGTLVGFVMNDDDAIALPNHQPLAAPRAGWVAAQVITLGGQAGALGFVALADQSFTLAEPQPSEVYGTRVGEDGRSLEYLATGPNGPVFVVATPEGSALFELPNASLPSGVSQVVDSAGRFRLLQGYDTNAPDPADPITAFVRVDVESGEAILVDPEPPAGWSWFDCYARNARIEADGALLFEVRDPGSARLWAFEPEGAQWSEVGLATGLVDDLDFAARSGSVHAIRATAQFMTFCPPNDWSEAPADALIGDSMQVLRRSPALAFSLPSTGWGEPVVIDDQERCVAYPSESGWRVRSLADQAELEFGSATGAWIWID